MVSPPPSIHALGGIAAAVSRATDLDAAFETLMIEVSRVLKTRASVLQPAARGWTLVAQTRGGLRVSISDLHAAVSGVSPDDSTAVAGAVDLNTIGEETWTSLRLLDAGEGPAMLLLAGDWTPFDSMLSALGVMLSTALMTVRER